MSTSQSLPYDQFRSLTLNLYQEPMRAPATQKKMRAALDSLLSVPGLVSTSDLTTQTFAKWLSAREQSNVNTTISLLGTLRTAVNYAIEEGWLEKAPSWSRIWPRSTAPAKRGRLDYDGTVKLLSHLGSKVAEGWKDHRNYALTSLIAYTGLRLNEALHSRREDYDLDRRIFWVSGRRRNKTEAAAAPVPMAEPLIPIIRPWLDLCEPTPRGELVVFPGVTKVAPWTGGSPGYRALDRLQIAAEECGLGKVTFHGFRRGLAQLIIGRFGGTAEHARILLRHTTARTTEEHYLDRAEEALLLSIVANVSFSTPS